MEKRQCKKKLKDFVSFSLIFFLVLLVLNIFSFNSAKAEIPILDDFDDSIDVLEVTDDVPLHAYFEEDLSVGSWFPLSFFAGHPQYPDRVVIFIPVSDPWTEIIEAGSWVIYSPSGKIFQTYAYVDWYELEPNYYLAAFEDPFWHVPVFAEDGEWIIELELIKPMVHFHFTINTANNTIKGQLTAPYYLYYGGLILGWGAFGLIIPCLFLILLTPMWFIVLFLLVRSYLGWGKLYSKEIRRYKKDKNKGGIIKNEEKKKDIGYYK